MQFKLNLINNYPFLAFLWKQNKTLSAYCCSLLNATPFLCSRNFGQLATATISWSTHPLPQAACWSSCWSKWHSASPHSSCTRTIYKKISVPKKVTKYGGVPSKFSRQTINIRINYLLCLQKRTILRKKILHSSNFIIPLINNFFPRPRRSFFTTLFVLGNYLI
jgi:hypothetical protein